MIVQVDWFKLSGKWAYGGRVEIEPMPWDKGIVQSICKNQKEIIKDWWQSNEFFMVVSDIPESENDPNYRMTYSRLYTPEQIERKMKYERQVH